MRNNDMKIVYWRNVKKRWNGRTDTNWLRGSWDKNRKGERSQRSWWAEGGRGRERDLWSGMRWLEPAFSSVEMATACLGWLAAGSGESWVIRQPGFRTPSSREILMALAGAFPEGRWLTASPPLVIKSWRVTEAERRKSLSRFIRIRGDVRVKDCEYGTNDYLFWLVTDVWEFINMFGLSACLPFCLSVCLCLSVSLSLFLCVSPSLSCSLSPALSLFLSPPPTRASHINCKAMTIEPEPPVADQAPATYYRPRTVSPGALWRHTSLAFASAGQ